MSDVARRWTRTSPKHPDDGVPLSEADKHALVAFLKTLTDAQFAGV